MIAPGATPAAFEANASKYRCCCNKCHVTDATRYLVYFELLVVVLNLIASMISLSWAGVVPCLIKLVVCALVLVGLKKQHGGWLIPQMIMQVITIVFLLFLCVVMVGVMIGAESLSAMLTQSGTSTMVTPKDVQTSITITAVVALVAALLGAVGETFSLMIVFRCYQYLTARRAQPTLQMVHQPQAVFITTTPSGYYQPSPSTSYGGGGYAPMVYPPKPPQTSQDHMYPQIDPPVPSYEQAVMQSKF